MLRRLLLCFALLFCPVRLLAELQVFELQHADAETLLPIVQPLLGPYESVSVYRNSLVVSADAGAMSRISELLAELDTPQRNLLISVRRNGTADSSQTRLTEEPTAITCVHGCSIRISSAQGASKKAETGSFKKFSQHNHSADQQCQITSTRTADAHQLMVR